MRPPIRLNVAHVKALNTLVKQDAKLINVMPALQMAAQTGDNEIVVRILGLAAAQGTQQRKLAELFRS